MKTSQNPFSTSWIITRSLQSTEGVKYDYSSHIKMF